MAETTQATTGLAQILSAEKMPRRPALRGNNATVDLENWIIALEHYFRRLYGLFNAANILNTINDSDDDGVTTGGFGAWEKSYERWIKVAAGYPVATQFVLINEDWRGRQVSAAGNAVNDSAVDNFYWDIGSGSFYSDKVGVNYNLDRTIASGSTTGGSWAFVIRGSDGKPVLEVDTSTATEPIHVQILAYATARKTVPDLTL